MPSKPVFSGLADLVCQAIDSGKIRTAEDLHRFKFRWGKANAVSQLPSNPDLVLLARNPSQKALFFLSIKPVRTASGVAPVAIMGKPANCPHGSCIFCPGGEESVFGSIPKSYTGNEPASMRAKANSFDPFLQTFNRLYQLVSTGHSVSKVELILMGGTFPSFGETYQDSFVRDSFAALNFFSDQFFSRNRFLTQKFLSFLQSDSGETSVERLDRVQSKLRKFQKSQSSSLIAEQMRNESSNCRMVALCIETKPDWCKESHINQMLKLGCTRVELGIQALDDEILSFANRGHSLADSVEATRLLRDSGLKVTYHMMPGLPKSTPEMDVAMFRELFSNPDYCPDALKIYPCMVMPGTPLEKLFKAGKFSPMDTETAVEVIAKAKRFFPKWVRVQRVMRDIPTKWSFEGVRSNNLRQLVEKRCLELGIKCNCIRCREVGHSQNGKNAKLSRQKISVTTYEASHGTELFISSEDPFADVLFGFCRLRIPFEPFRSEIDSKTALVRELHVFGKAQSIGESDAKAVQHHGLGHELLAKAEQLAGEKFDKTRVVVISGVGARNYYRKLGYRRSGPYMAKKLDN